MAKLTLNNVTSGYQSSTASNANNDLIEAAVENTLSRDGTSPNQMTADLDMNSNDILNTNSVATQALTIAGTSVVAGSTLSVPSALNVPYDATTSTLSETTVQAAIDELADASSVSTKDFHDAEYIADAQIAFIRDNDTASQTAATVNTGLQAMFAAAITYLDGASDRIATLHFNGSYAISDELISEASAQVMWDTAKTDCRLVMKGGVFRATGWASHKAVRTSGLYSGITDNVPMAMLRWENQAKTGFRLDLQDVAFYGERAKTTDPIGVKLRNHNDGHHRNLRIADFYNSGLWIEDINNSRFIDTVISRCGYQPTQSAGDGFIPSGTTVTTSTVANVTTVTASAAVFEAAHAGKWLMIEDVGESGTTFTSTIATFTDSTHVILTDEATLDAGSKAFSFACLRGDFNANTTVTLETDVTDDLDGRYIMGFKAGSVAHSEQDLYVGLVASHDGTTGIVLKDACANTVAGVPIVVAPGVYVGRTEDADSGGHNNDTQFVAMRVEHSFNTDTGSAVPIVAQNILASQFIGCKFHGTSEAYNNFGANEFGMVIDNGKHLQSWGCMFDHCEWSPDYAKIPIMGGFNTVFLENIRTGNATPADRTADIYLDPQGSDVEDCQIYVSGRIGRQAGNWGLSGQSFSRLGANGSQLMLGSAGPLITRDLSTFADQPSNQWNSWTVNVDINGVEISTESGSYTTRTGRYRIIDGMCEVYLSVTIAAVGTGTGAVTVDLPVLPAWSGEFIGLTSCTSMSGLANGGPFGATNTSTGLVLRRPNTAGTGTTAILDSNLGAGSQFAFSGRYRVV